ncbi:dihydrolipoyl dehydrogenase [Alkaliphilus transvaalensis]|uniref:dihydrolipoyl dehydrogenase n=1 Tax=Alkaliphilus transvaalensis TaxID=114628 RepID=UPI000479D41D|nr:dihydrolipoyl dehydrogenase [Alkaliphilus transvaalensis]
MIYDIIVIGGGPGGYVAAIKAAQLGGKVALVEKEALGGVCLNWGCIPTKALLKNAKVYQEILKSDFYGIEGISKKELKINWKTMIKRKDSVVRRLVRGVESLLVKNKVEIIRGFANFIDNNIIDVEGQKIEGKKIIIATGGKPQIPNIPGLREAYEKDYLLTSKEILNLKELPKSLLILGGGVIGVEFATLFNSLGVKVTLLQRSERILSGVETEMADTLTKHLKKNGLVIQTNCQINRIQGNTVVATVNGEEKIFEGDKILIALGTKPNLKGLEGLKLETDNRGIVTNEKLETNIEGIYAIGDVNGKYLLAHVASAEGLVAASNAMGGDEVIDYKAVPSCIYSFPEIASVGLTEEEAKEKGHQVVVSKFPISANGKAMAEGESVGFVKVIADQQYGEILGTHIMAVHATDMISEAVISMELEGTAEDVAKAIHPHPTLSEIVMEAAHGITGHPIHI